MLFLQMTLTGAALICVVAVIRLAAGRALPRRAFVLLWGIVVLRLLIPFPSLLGFELPQRAEAASEPAYSAAVTVEPAPTAASVGITEPQTGIIDHTGPRTDATAAPIAQPAETAAVVIPAGTAPDAVTETIEAVPSSDPAAEPVREPVPLAAVLRYVWLAGAVIAAAVAIALYAKGYRRFARAVPDVSEAAQAWLEEHPLRRGLSLRRLEGAASPLTYGVFRPVIIVPADFDLTVGAAKLALEHEYVHARRFDPAFKLILTAALAVHWFNPAVWLMYFLASRDVELACDEAVLRSLGTDGRADYARALLSMEERRGPTPALRVSFGSNQTKERINAIMRFKKRSALAIVLAAALTLGLAACAVTGPRTAPELSPEVEKAVAATVEARCIGTHAEGEFSAADIRPLAVETKGGRTTVYAVALWEAFSREDGEIKVVSGAHFPCAVTVEKNENGQYRCVDFRQPGDGSKYAEDVKKIFPRSVRADAADVSKFSDEQHAALMEKAEAWFASSEGRQAKLYITDDACIFPLKWGMTRAEAERALDGYELEDSLRGVMFEGELYGCSVNVALKFEWLTDGNCAVSVPEDAGYVLVGIDVLTDDRAAFAKNVTGAVGQPLTHRVGYYEEAGEAGVKEGDELPEENYFWRSDVTVLDLFTLEECGKVDFATPLARVRYEDLRAWNIAQNVTQDGDAVFGFNGLLLAARAVLDRPAGGETGDVFVEFDGYRLRVPERFYELLVIQTADETLTLNRESEDGAETHTYTITDITRGALFRVSEKASVESGQRQHPGEDHGDGWIFSISRHPASELEELRRVQSIGGADIFATDAEGYLYVFFTPTDVRLTRDGGRLMYDREYDWLELNDWGYASVRSAFIADNGLTPFSALPPMAEKRDYAMEDTFVISRDGEDFVLSSAGLDATTMDVYAAYGVGLSSEYPAVEVYSEGALPPIGGDIRFGTSYAEAYERICGAPCDREPGALLGTGYCNSYAGALCKIQLQIDAEERVYFIGIYFEEGGDDAATWFELYRKFTELFGEPMTAWAEGRARQASSTNYTDYFSTPDELRALLEEGRYDPGIVWGDEQKAVVVKMNPITEGRRQLCIQMVWYTDPAPMYGSTTQVVTGG